MENKQNFNVDKRKSMKNCRKLTENFKTIENEANREKFENEK